MGFKHSIFLLPSTWLPAHVRMCLLFVANDVILETLQILTLYTTYVLHSDCSTTDIRNIHAHTGVFNLHGMQQ